MDSRDANEKKSNSNESEDRNVGKEPKKEYDYSEGIKDFLSSPIKQPITPIKPPNTEPRIKSVNFEIPTSNDLPSQESTEQVANINVDSTDFMGVSNVQSGIDNSGMSGLGKELRVYQQSQSKPPTQHADLTKADEVQSVNPYSYVRTDTPHNNFTPPNYDITYQDCLNNDANDYWGANVSELGTDGSAKDSTADNNNTYLTQQGFFSNQIDTNVTEDNLTSPQNEDSQLIEKFIKEVMKAMENTYKTSSIKPEREKNYFFKITNNLFEIANLKASPEVKYFRICLEIDKIKQIYKETNKSKYQLLWAELNLIRNQYLGHFETEAISPFPSRNRKNKT